MARILVITSSESGRARPLVGVAQWLRRSRHTVGWLGPSHAPPELRRAGVEPFVLPPEALEPASDPAARAEARKDEQRAFQLERDRLFSQFAERVKVTRRLIREQRADAVLIDDTQYASALAAHLEHVRFIVATASLGPLHQADDPLTRLAAAIVEERRTAFEASAFQPELRGTSLLSPLLTLIFATKELGNPEPASTLRLVGPSEPPEGWDPDPTFDGDPLNRGRPVVYVSFGERHCWEPELFSTLARAAEPLGVTLAIHAGALAHSDVWVGLPGDVVVYRRVPQSELLDRVAVFVHHGGPTSTMEGLSHGVPMCTAPLWPDGYAQAAALRTAEAARVLEPDATVEAWREALRAALERAGQLRATALRLRTSYRAADGARSAAEAISAAIK